ncbi:hypothetical protein LZ31DRAFT_202570 [Colletotrichum somersetense]|nr:hypothetical protein LZ31DRAFT_202570 [Colletotrichum somersetense]
MIGQQVSIRRERTKVHLFSFPLIFLQIAHAARQNRPSARRNRRRAKLRGKTKNTLRDAIDPSRIKRQSKTASSISAALWFPNPYCGDYDTSHSIEPLPLVLSASPSFDASIQGPSSQTKAVTPKICASTARRGGGGTISLRSLEEFLTRLTWQGRTIDFFFCAGVSQANAMSRSIKSGKEEEQEKTRRNGETAIGWERHVSLPCSLPLPRSTPRIPFPFTSATLTGGRDVPVQRCFQHPRRMRLEVFFLCIFFLNKARRGEGRGYRVPGREAQWLTWPISLWLRWPFLASLPIPSPWQPASTKHSQENTDRPPSCSCTPEFPGPRSA